MYRKMIGLLIMAVVVGGLTVPPVRAADVAKIAYVDLQRVFTESEAGKNIAAAINTKGKSMQAELEKKKSEIEEMQSNFENQAMVLSEEMREKKKRDLQIKMLDFKALQKKYKTELQTENQEKLQKLQDEIMKLIQQRGKREGYLLIVEKLAVLYAPNAIDLTDEIIEAYNASYRGQ